jgi:hypothetical protein
MDLGFSAAIVFEVVFGETDAGRDLTNGQDFGAWAISRSDGTGRRILTGITKIIRPWAVIVMANRPAISHPTGQFPMGGAR